MLVKVSIYFRHPFELTDALYTDMWVNYNGATYSVDKIDVVRCEDDICVDDSKLTEQTKVQTSYR